MTERPYCWLLLKHLRAMAVTDRDSWAPLAGDHELVPGDALDGLACSTGDAGVKQYRMLVVWQIGVVGQALMRCSVGVTFSTRQDMQVLAMQDVYRKGNVVRRCQPWPMWAEITRGCMQGSAVLGATRSMLCNMAHSELPPTAFGRTRA